VACERAAIGTGGEPRTVMPKLLWGCLWRGSVLGLACGASLGAVYGALLLTAALVAESIGSVLGVSDGSADAWLGAFYLAPYGAVFGAVFGAFAGLPLGVLLGLLAAVVTAVCSWQRRDVWRCRQFLGWASAVLSIVVLLGLWLALGSDPAAFVFVENTSGLFDDGPVDLVFVVLVPTVVAGAAGWWIGRRVGGWSAREATAPR
jgi:hypothetical protein